MPIVTWAAICAIVDGKRELMAACPLTRRLVGRCACRRVGRAAFGVQAWLT